MPNPLRHLTPEVAARAHDLGPDLVQEGLSVEVLSAVQMRLSYRQCAAVVAGALELTGDAGLGLYAGSGQHATAWGLVGLLLMSAPDVVTGTLRATWAETTALLDDGLAVHSEQQELLVTLAVAVTDLPRVPPIAEQARRLLVSERTLLRRLAGMGTSYEAVMDAVRRDRAEQLLARGALSAWRWPA